MSEAPSKQTINSRLMGGAYVGEEQLRAGEEVVADIPVNRRQLGIFYGGRLVLTNQRLVFLPGKSPNQRANLSLNLESISQIRPQRMRLAVTFSGRAMLPRFNIAGIAVETGSTKYDFELGGIRTGDRARWMEMLKNAITKTPNGGS